MAETTNPQGETENIDSATLEGQEAQTSSKKAVRSSWQTFVAQKATAPKLIEWLKSAANWSPERLMEFAQEVEERDPHFRSVLSTRKLAITGLTWTVTPASDEARDVEIANFVSDTLTDGAFSGLLFDCLDGISKGYSVVEIVWKVNGDQRLVPAQYLWVDQTYLNFDEDTQTRIQLITENEPVYGEPLQFGKFIQHVPKLKSGVIARSGLIFTVSALYLMKSFVTKDWLSFSEVFGMPIRWAKLMGNLTEEEKDDVFKALMALSSDATAIFDQNVEVEFKGVNNTTHGDFYEKAVRFWNQEISKVTLGQTMTSEDGSSLAQAKVHNDVRLDIRNADARSLEETINTYLVAPLVDFNFGVDSDRPRFTFNTAEKEDLEQLAKVVSTLSDHGLPIPQAWAYEEFGIPQPEPGEAVLSVGTTVNVNEGAADLPDGAEAMTAIQAADALGITVTQVYGLVAHGDLTRHKLGARSRFLKSEVEALAEVWANSPFEGTTTGSIAPPGSTHAPSDDTSSISSSE